MHGIADDRISSISFAPCRISPEIGNASLVAEGIERSEDGICIRDMGIACARATSSPGRTRQPPRQLAGRTLSWLDQQSSVPVAVLTGWPGKLPTARTLAKPIELELCMPAMPR